MQVRCQYCLQTHVFIEPLHSLPILKIWAQVKLFMVSTARFYKASGPSLAFVERFPVSHAPTLSAKFTKVCWLVSSLISVISISFLGSVGLVSRFGQFYKSVDPGLVQVNICTESLKVVDVKIQISPIGRQTVM
jgi:hypothetical protein